MIVSGSRGSRDTAMFALRSSASLLDAHVAPESDVQQSNPNDWLSVSQAACELGVSSTTIRRRIHDGLLRTLTVPRNGGFSYRVYLPESRHGRDASLRATAAAKGPAATEGSPIDLTAYRRRRDQLRQAQPQKSSNEPRSRIEGQPERLPESLMQALSLQARPLRASFAGASAGSPFGQYRQLVRKRRWWPF
jgi:hypothetical protein